MTISAVSDTPANTALPIITGTLAQGQALAATNGSWTNNSNPIDAITYNYQWRRDVDGLVGGELDIPGETSSTYTLAADDLGQYLSVAVTASANA